MILTFFNDMYVNKKRFEESLNSILHFFVIACFANRRLSDVVLSNPDFSRPGVVKPYFQ